MAKTDAIVEFRKKITPYRVTELLDCTVYEFFRINSAKPIPLNRDAKMELAIISIHKDKKWFDINYCPLDKDLMQTVEGLPIERLSEMVNELILAGFK